MITSKTRAGNALNAILLNINSAGNGSLRIYAGTAPPDLATSPGTLLAQCSILDAGGAFANAVTGGSIVTATGNLVGGKWAEDTSADATGTAGYFRVYDQSGVAVYQGTVGTTGSGADLELNTLSIVATAVVTITSAVVSITGIY